MYTFVMLLIPINKDQQAQQTEDAAQDAEDYDQVVRY
jgi:hypothetical protein